MVAVVALSACASIAAPRPTADDVAWLEAQDRQATLEGLTEGRRLFVSRCTDCHTLVPPSEVAPEDWPEEVDRMVRKKAMSLSPRQRERLKHYLMAASARARSASASGSAR